MVATGQDRGCDAEYCLRRFLPEHAGTVATWVDSIQTRRWVSPSVVGSVTAEIVRGWVKPGGEALVLFNGVPSAPVAYGELNPMRVERRHHWLGHLIVQPGLRGRGIGLRLTLELLEHAFIERSALRVSLIVFPDNRAAIRCYVTAGFQLRGEEFHRFAPGTRAGRLLRFQIDHARYTSLSRAGERCATIG